MRHVLIAIVVLLPALARADPPEVALGVGVQRLRGNWIHGTEYTYTIGVRITDREWLTATYGQDRSIEYQDSVGHEFRELYAQLAHVGCGRVTCGVVSAGLGYQHAKFEFFDPIVEAMPSAAEDSAVFADARVALRLNLGAHVWVEGHVALREYLRIHDTFDDHTLFSGLLGTTLSFAIR